MPAFSNDGLPIHYQLRGNGEPVLLIHGLGSSGADWALQVCALERRFLLIVPDLPGSGNSAVPSGPYTIAAFATSMWSLIDHLNIRKVNIVGFSMGGAIALEMALRQPERVPRLALINSLLAYRDHWRKWVFARTTATLIRCVGMRRAARIFAEGLFPEPWQRTIRERAAAVVAAVPARSYLGMALALEHWSAPNGLDRLKSRTMVIAAEYDHTPLAEKRALAAKLHADLVVVRGSRHGTPFDASEATNASLLALLLDQSLPPNHRLALDTPAGAQASLVRGVDRRKGATAGAVGMGRGATTGSSVTTVAAS